MREFRNIEINYNCKDLIIGAWIGIDHDFGTSYYNVQKIEDVIKNGTNLMPRLDSIAEPWFWNEICDLVINAYKEEEGVI